MSDARRNAVALVLLVVGALLIAIPLAARLLALPLGSRATAALGCLGIVAAMFGSTMRWSGDQCASAPRALRQRYLREFIPPMLAYVVVMLFWKPLLASVDMVWLRVVIAVLPALLVLLALRSIMRYVRDSDEMQRRIELESIALAAGAVSTGYMTAGFLQSAKLIAIGATSAMLWVFPLLCLSYGLTKMFIARRFQ